MEIEKELKAVIENRADSIQRASIDSGWIKKLSPGSNFASD